MSFFYGSPNQGISQFWSQTILHHKLTIFVASLFVLATIPFAAYALNDNTPILPATTKTSGNQDTANSEQYNSTSNPTTAKETPTAGTNAQNNVSSASVTINGESVDIPANGTVNKYVTTPDGNGTVTVQVQSSSSNSGTINNRSSLKVRTSTSSRETSSTQTNATITNKGELQP